MSELSTHGEINIDVIQRNKNAISRLLRARRMAHQSDVDTWQFAIELECLKAEGISKTDLRWLVCQQLISHAVEVTLQGAAQRSFEQSTCLQFANNSCFIISEKSERICAEACGKPEHSAASARTPAWSAESRDLRFDGEVVKQFRRPAHNQETVLTAFEEEQWVMRIDDPLPPQDGKDPKRRLHDTINALNRNQRRERLRFFGDGTGEGICWEARAKSSTQQSEV